MAQELCQCQSGTHGHEPGKCPNPATQRLSRIISARPVTTKQSPIRREPPSVKLPLECPSLRTASGRLSAQIEGQGARFGGRSFTLEHSSPVVCCCLFKGICGEVHAESVGIRKARRRVPENGGVDGRSQSQEAARGHGSRMGYARQGAREADQLWLGRTITIQMTYLLAANSVALNRAN